VCHPRGSHLFADKLPKAVLRIDSGRVYEVGELVGVSNHDDIVLLGEAALHVVRGFARKKPTK
jgi:hypothetical protein